ncbi:lipopolysaccharide biosynthesis protein [Nitriliruptor alkaliphilus]|uniref:lipopolysaccharide biosynthesis protein n=1 Tax=Nitriliruptor alkaliphilus TaxID=427918 RepID=UPI0006966D9C|nr:lipopolysaccharide biosynthesis protein [Nitriliruptor alkaliphilus]
MAELPPARSTSDLTRQTLAGLQWTYLGSAVSVVFQFGMTAVLARLLSPAAFGLVALAGLFLRFVNYFARAGVTQALVQKATLSAVDIRAGFTLSAGLGTGFAVVALFLAPLAGTIAQDPALVPVLRWMAVGLALSGLGAPATALLRRHLRFKALTLVGIVSYLVGYAGVGLALAFSGAGVYSLVFAHLAQTAVNTVGGYAMVRHPVLPALTAQPYRVILGFGARISVIGFFEFLRSNLDTLAVGRFAGATQLGFYNRANLIADLPAYHLAHGLSQVLFPSFSSIQHEHARLRDAYLSAVGVTAAIVLPMNLGMAVAAREIVLVLLGPRWTGAIEVMPWLLLASSISLVGHFAGVVAEAQAALNAKMLIAAGSALTLAALLLLARGGPLSGYGAALATTALVSHIGYVALISRTLETRLGALFRPYGRALVAAAVVSAAIAVGRMVLLRFTGAPVAVVLVAEVATGAITLGLMFSVGPLRPLRGELADRLAAAGVLDAQGGVIWRTIGRLVRPPTG